MVNKETSTGIGTNRNIGKTVKVQGPFQVFTKTATQAEVLGAGLPNLNYGTASTTIKTSGDP